LVKVVVATKQQAHVLSTQFQKKSWLKALSNVMLVESSGKTSPSSSSESGNQMCSLQSHFAERDNDAISEEWYNSRKSYEPR
jgi:hypothetical protein